MRVLNCNITITTDTDTFIFPWVHDIKITSTWKNLTDMGKIVIPRRLSFQGRDIVAGENPLLKAGNKISITVGYKKNEESAGEMNELISGYVSEIQPKLPIEISVQDDMYVLKHNSITKTYNNVTLSNLLKDLLPSDMKFNAIETTIGQLRITRASTAQVLQELQKSYGLESWFRDGILYCGLAYVPELRKDANFTFTKNIISDDLKFRKAEDVQIKVTIKNLKPDNTHTEYTTGGVDVKGKLLPTDDCQEMTLYTYNLSEADAKAQVNREISKLRYTGFYGKFTAFGEPFVRHGDGAKLHDPVLPERDGTYLIKQVEYSFGMEGYRQEIELANKIL